VKSHHYWKAIDEFKLRLRDAVPHEDLKALHVRRPAVHLAYALRQFAIITVCSVGLFHLTNPLLWIPLAILQGFTFFNMTTLLHEVVHDSVFGGTHPRLNRALGLLYAMTSGISASQFTRWHLDHHDNLGSYEDDPKRHWLSPKRNARWFKLLYCTPALMPIYFRAAASEARSYPPELRKTIARERMATMAFQFTVMGLLYFLGGAGPMLRVQLVPYFLVFPVAFTLNRLGQHYDIDPTDPARWTTLVNGNPAWHFLFLWSNFHVEHHYYQRVPFYNLRRLNRDLQPFYDRTGLRNRTYREMLWGWFVLNKEAHTDWEMPEHSEPSARSDRAEAPAS
jgi:fatty acid desaturase